MDERGAARFDPYHAKAGSPAGGQFTSSSGSGSGSKGAAKPAAAPPAVSGAHGDGQGTGAARKARLLAEAHEDDQRARELEKELRGLEQQEHAAQEAARKSAASAAAAKKAGHVVHHRHHAAAHKHHKHHARTLKERISALKGRIRGLREHAAELEKQAHAIRAAGMVTNPEGTERLHQYWVHGAGAAKIRWGQPGDFDRCVLHLGKFIRDPQGYCNLAHKAALGIYPATHAAEIRKATGRSAVTTATKAPYGDVPYGDPGYLDADGNQASKSGKPGVKRYPLSADKVMAAWSYINQKDNAGQYTPEQLKAIKGRVKAAMAKHGHDVSDQPASASRSEFLRIYPLEDMHIMRSADGGDGRTVEAFAAVFEQEAEIMDFEGHYLEVIDRSAFNRRLEHIERMRGGLSNIKCLYNHGQTIQGTPSDRFSMPIGVPVVIRAESRGLLTRTRYSETPLADEVLENIRSGTITAQSFVGPIMRSDPGLRRGDRYRPSGGKLPTIRRMELGLRDYGPVVFPAYSGAEILGVRMSTPGSWSPDPDEEIEYDPGTPSDGGPAAGDPLEPAEAEHSARYHQHALYELRSKEAREAAGLVW